MAKTILTGKGRRWLMRGHPWVYRDDLSEATGESGELVAVEEPSGDVFGWGLYSQDSRIAVRMVSRGPEQPNRAFWLARVQRAVDARAAMGLLDPAGACRLIGGDADGLPGFVADRYGKVLVLQCSTPAADRMRDFLLELIDEALPFPLEVVVDRSDVSVRRLEKLDPRVEVVRGSLPEELVVEDQGLRFEVDVLEGHKTGAYLDQRDNRLRAARHAAGATVLDAFSYDGLFGIRAALAGATDVLCLDQNAAAGERVLRNAERNGVADRVRFERVDCMKDLKARAEGDERYGLVVVDPPAFARNKKELPGAERGYVELFRRGMALTRPGGHLVAASCSYAVRPHDFLHYLGAASQHAGRDTWVELLAGASPDHPWLLRLPESDYLKCAFVRVG